MTGVVLIKSALAISVVGEGLITTMAIVDPSIPNIISVVVGAVVTITMGVIAYKTVMLNKKFDDQNKKVDLQGEKLDLTLRKTEVIEGHVNSEKTEAQGKITTLQKENALLREMMADKVATAALLAQAAATASATAAVHAPAVPNQSPAILKSIDKHVEDTVNNTARTVADVQDLKEKQ